MLKVCFQFRKWIAGFLVVCVFSTQTVTFNVWDLLPEAKAKSNQAPTVTKINLVAILVEKSIFENQAKYQGLQNEFPEELEADTLEERVIRYGKDAQKAMPYTKALLIKVNQDEKTYNIAHALEKLYFEGDGTEGEFNRLAGVVVIGRVPLPVVNKNGHHFVSLYPYTDFEEKRYIYNPKTANFELNSDGDTFQPEIWHGVIAAPLEGEEGANLLATYFDKNHLFHSGNNKYATFDRQMLYQDFLNEPNELSPQQFKNYETFLKHWEDIVYMRYNKNLAYQLFKEFNESLVTGDKADNDGDGRIDEEIGTDTDEDKDGLKGEDVGDAFYMRDNDNDGLIDEDSTDDNDNDGDNRTDEDPEGDANNDGCPGVCGVDDDNDSLDFDKDGYPNGQEKAAGTNPNDPDDKPGGSPLPSANFVDEGSPNDDDEDGAIDEDGVEDNDADGDEEIDEDSGAPVATENNFFENVPDIQSEGFITSYFSRFNQLFNRFLSESNDSVRYTGYFRDQYALPSGKLRSDVDSAPSLIAQKDEYTMNYLKIANDQYEKKIDEIIDQIQQKVPLISDVKVSGSATLNGKSYTLYAKDFINHSKFGERYYVLGRQYYVEGDDDYAQQLTSPLQCTLYRGSASDGKENAIAVYASRLNDYTTVGKADENKDYKGCYGNNALNPHRCFPDAATDPVFDIKGAKRVESGKDYKMDWRACFDLKEKGNFEEFVSEVDEYVNAIDDAENDEEREQIDEDKYPRSSRIPYNRIYLVDQDSDPNDNNSIYFSLADAFTVLGLEDGFAEMVEYMIDGSELTFRAQNIALNEDLYVNSLTLKMDPKVIGQIASAFPHKEPTISTIRTQFQAGFTMDIPVDNPRYTSFRDQNGDFRKVIYPNVFDSKTLDDFKAMIEAKIAELNQIPGAAQYTEDLSTILGRKLDEAHVNDALNWKKMDINTKHLEALKGFLSPEIKPYVSNSKQENGYEAVYIVSEGDSKNLYFGINPMGTAAETDTEYNNVEALARQENGEAPQPEEEFSTEPDFSENEEGDDQDEKPDDGSGKKGLGDKALNILTKWLPEMTSWYNEAKSSMKLNFSTACGSSQELETFLSTVLNVDSESAESALDPFGEEDGQFSRQVQDTDQDGVADDQDQDPYSSDSNEDSVPDPAEATTGLKLTISSNLFKVGDKSDFNKVTIYAVDSAGSTNLTDSFTKAQLFFLTPEEAEEDLRPLLEEKLANNDTGADLFSIGSANPAQITNGETFLQIQPGSYEGELYVVSMSTNRPDNDLISNKIKIKVTKEYINLYGYQKEIVRENKIEGVDTIAAVKIRDEQDVLVGDVSTATGAVILRHDDYMLAGEEGTNEFPSRFYVRNKKTSTNEAVVFLRPKEEVANIVNLKALPKSAMSSYAGVNVSDGSSSDNVRVTYSQTSIGNVDILNGTEKIGFIQPDGRIFVANDEIYGIEIAKPETLEDVVIFNFVDKARQKVLAQIWINTTPEIQVIEPTDEYEELLNSNEEVAVLELGKDRFIKIGYIFDSLILPVSAATRDIPDSDGDALNDFEEFMLNTREDAKDTDGDGFNDGEETRSGFNPLKQYQKLFKDLDKSDEAFKAIMDLYIRGVLSGFKDGTFRPNQKITREEFVKLDLGAICVACTKFTSEKQNETAKSYNRDPFPDTGEINPDLKMCVAEGKNRGIVSGYKGGEKDGYFLPRKTISFAEASKVLLETAKIPVFKQNKSPKPWYYDYVATSQKLSLYPKGRFKELEFDSDRFLNWFDYQIQSQGAFIKWLNGDVSRGEFAMMVVKILDIKDCRMVDSDFDGIPDAEEINRYGTNPFNADSDSDSLLDLEELISGFNPTKKDEAKKVSSADKDFDSVPDAYEQSHGLNSLDGTDGRQDLDFDGLTNLEEFLLGTDPRKVDTDQGGVNDYDEVKIFDTDPLNKNDDIRGNDFDNDALSNELEKKIGSNPYKADTDSGGELDGSEFKAGRNLLDDRDDLKDSDKDGLRDDEELRIGTDIDNADTDQGGELDFHEISRGSNPLDPKDDQRDSDKDDLSDLAESVLGTNLKLWDSDNGGEGDGSEHREGRNPFDPKDDIKDLDSDGLYNKEELFQYKTNPKKWDTDGGGQDDGSEVKAGKNPLDPSDDILDSDGDGLSDFEEIRLGTSVNRWDTDLDGMSDLSEIFYNKDPKNPKDFIKDPDQDGLEDKDEIAFGSNPTLYDTDRGSESDYNEFKNKKNPLDPSDDAKDSDLDGLSDEAENSYGTNPNKRDSDQGGAHDLTEILTGSNPLDRADDNLDVDKDGLSDNDERLFGSDPLKFDTDFGGEHDGSEYRARRNPRNGKDDQKTEKKQGRPDKDRDYLPDEDENRYKTNPLNPDSDNGGEGDLSEILRKSNPLNKEDDIISATVNDFDGDGLTNEQETEIYFTNPNKWDSDGGLQSDGAEIAEDKNPLNPSDDKRGASFSDFDGDGLSNELEFRKALDINRRDTDRGGEDDFKELESGTDPFDPDDDFMKRDSDRDGLSDADKLSRYLTDPDNDGLPNEKEEYHGSDPLVADTDKGGVNDGDEVNNGTSPIDGGDDDPDKDGLPNAKEADLKSDPRNSDSDSGGVMDGEEYQTKKDLLNPEDDDPDNDELSNQKEKKLGTDPNRADSDNGGALDGYEVKNGTNPLDGSDDFANDSDKDGMSDKEEKAKGTNPNESDSDLDSVSDMDEVIRGTDPKNPEDGETLGIEEKLDPRVYIVGEKIETIYEKPFETENKIVKSSIPADGESWIYFIAEIKNSDGSTKSDDNQSLILFTISTEGEKSAYISQKSVKVTNGRAETAIRSQTKANLVSIKAEIAQSQTIPPSNFDLVVHALEAAEITFRTDSATLISGGYSESTLWIELRDKFGNLANNNLEKFTINATGPIVIEGFDEDKSMDGIQATTFNGNYKLRVKSSEDSVGTGIVTVKVGEISRSFEYLVVDDARLDLTIEPSEIKADGQSELKLMAKVVDQGGALIPNYGGPIEFKVSDQIYGQFQGSNVLKMENSLAETYFKVGTVSGEPIFSVVSEGISPISKGLKLLPNASAKIELFYPPSVTVLANSEITVTAKLFDKFRNFNETDSKSVISLRLTDGSKAYAELIETQVTAVNGLARFKLRTLNDPGPINLVASSFKNPKQPKVVSGTLSLNSKRKIDKTYVQETKPNILYASLMGVPAGKVFERDYFGGWLLMSGKTEAITTLTEPLNLKKQLLKVNIGGGIKLFDETVLGVNVLAANSASYPTLFSILNLKENSNLGKLFIKPRSSDMEVIEDEIEISDLNYGIYIRNEIKDPAYQIKLRAKGRKLPNDERPRQSVLSITENGEEKVRIEPNLAIQLYDSGYALFLDKSYDYPTIMIMRESQLVAKIFVWQKFENPEGVIVLPTDYDLANYNQLKPGVYLKPAVLASKYVLEHTFSGNSSNEAQGIAISDQESDIEGDQKPGTSIVGLESILSKRNIGFDGDNKHMLYFSGGVHVGEANKPYAAETGIVLGDPLIRLKRKGAVSETGYTKDVGRLILTGSETFKDITSLDYNGDNKQDVLISMPDGKIQLLENVNSYPRLIDRGTILNITNGIYAMDKGDLNNDGLEDLVIATRDSCLKDETCVYVYLNRDGNFERRNLPLNIDYRVQDLKVGDLNKDGYDDIVTSDYSATIKAFYNVNGDINLKGQVVGNLGIKVDRNGNLKNEVLVHYSGMTTNNPKKPQDDFYFRNLPVENPEGYGGTLNDETLEKTNEVLEKLKNAGVTVELAQPNKQKMVSFVYLDYDQKLLTSIKKAEDLNGGRVERGEKVRYTISLKNTDSSAINDLMLSDISPHATELDMASIRCLQCAPENQPKVYQTRLEGRAYIFTNIDIPAGGTIDIVYELTVNEIPKVNIAIGDNLSADYPVDERFDVWAQIEENNTGKQVYFYSTGEQGKSFNTTKESALNNYPEGRNVDYEEVQYRMYITEPLTEEEVTEVLEEVAPEIIPQAQLERQDGEDLCQWQKDKAKSRNEKDCNGDGLPDAFSGSLPKDKSAEEQVGEALDDVAEDVENFIAKSTCAGGCLPIPINFAFFAPGAINIMGAPGGFDPGLPLFGFGVPGPFGIPLPCAGPLCYASLIFRYYLVPTLTLKVMNAFCVGPYMGGFCITYPFPDGGSDDNCEGKKNGFCDSVKALSEKALGAVNKAIAKINEAADEMASSINVVGGQARRSPRNESAGMVGTGLSEYKVNALVSTNFSLPPFPILADWIKRQWEEITDKILSDPPDMYVIFPSLTSFANQDHPGVKNVNIESFQSLNDVLAFFNSFPFVRVKTKEVTLNVPIITADEIEKIKLDAIAWVYDAKRELAKISALWDYENYDENISKKIILDTSNFIAAIEANIAALESWKRLPYQLVDLMNIETFYIRQLVCYLDAIVEVTIGWLKRNMERWYMWKRAFEEIKKAISDWKLLIKVAITYHASCDKCQTDRFSLLELVLRIFAALPQIPIIPLPKWPDIVLDASSLQVGVELVWPEINIRTQPFIFPTLPRLRLPRIPSLSFKLPDFPVLPEAPNFAALLPEFPPLPLVKIPDMPPPPAIPQLPGQIKVALRILEKIMLILCLLKTGKIIVPESLLKTEIEAQTQRALDPLLPLDLSLPILLPAIQYDFVKAIKLNVSVNMSVDTRFFYKKVKDFFDEINLKIQKYVDRANIFMNIGAQILDYGLNAGQQYLEEQMEEAAQDAQEELDKAEEDLQEDIDEALNPGEEEKNDRDKEDEYDGEELKTKTEPVTFEDKGFEDLPMLKPYIAELKKSFSAFEEITKGYEEQIAATPKIHHLVATQEFLYKNDPRLNRTIEDLKYNRAKYEMDSLPVSTQRIANLRDNLISTLERRASLADELKNTKSIPDALRIFAQGAKFGKYELASAQSKNGILFESSNESELASLLSGSNISQAKKEGFKALTTALKGSLAETSSFLEEVVTNSAQFTSKLIAQNGNPPPGNPDSSGLSLNLSGILVENKEKGTLEKLFEYDQETQLPGKNLFVDVDGDKDQDVLYFYGPNLYFKENYRYTSSSSIVTSSPKVYELIEMMPKAPSINGAKIIDIKNGKVTIGFQKQPFSAVKGYEVHYYSKVPEFDLPLKQQQAKSGVVFLSPKKGEIPISDTSVSDALNYAVTKGEVKVTKSNSGNDEAKTLYPGDSITTLEGSEAVLTWSDGSQLLIGANSAFRVPALANSNEISFSEGEFTILKRSGENVLLKSGKIISGANARVTIELHSEENIILESNSLFSLSELQKAGAFIKEVEGKTLITGGSRRFLEEGASASISGAESIHGLSESTVILSKGEGDNASAQITLKLKTQTIFAPSFDGTLTVEDGLIEIINPEKQIKDQEVRDEMVIFTNELLIAEDANSMARVGFSDSPELETTILGQESFKMVEFDDDAARADVTVELDLPNGDYYTKIYSVGFDGGRSTGSSMSLLPPQRCADQIPPVANAGSSSKQVALFKSLTLDVSASFDDIQVKDYWWDLDTRVDSNSDGDKSNDVDYFSTFDKPRKIIGPFKDLEKIPVKLFVRDDRNNISTQEVTVEVYVPEITLNEAAAKTGIIEGVLNPAESAMPITLLRKRGEAWEILKTESSEANGTYLSDSEGKFTINDLNLLQGVEIKNAAGKTVATVDAVTGHITVVDPAYQLKVFPSEPPLPTRVALIGPEGELVSTFYVPDANSDIVLDEEEIEYSKENVSKLSGVHVKDTNPEDEIAFKKIPADDPKNPGGVKAEQKNQGMGAGFLFTQALAQANGEILFEVTSNGSIYVYSEIVDLKLKESENPDDPVIIEFYVDGKKVGEQLISVKTAVRESIPIITIPKEKGAKDSDLDGLPDSYELAKKFNPKDSNDAKKDFDGDGLSNFAEYLQGTDPHKFDTDADTYSDKEEIEKGYNPNEKLISPFEDVAINYPKFKVLLDLVSKNVLQGYKENGKVYFKPDQKINRAEFTKIMLKVLCIAPRAEAYRSPPVFSDIPYITEKLPWFYDEVKESFLQGFITGYLGEIDQKTKKAPFKAENTITLAEATKIVLEALEKEGVIFMGKVILGEGQPWFAPYLQFATNLGYYLRKPSPGANEFILTEEEAKNPAKTLSRIEFVEMASRVLSAYDCSNVDNDKDKLPDNFEINNNLNPNLAADANQDPDKDGLKNIEEFVYGTDPHNADTDSGGEKDGAEVKNYTNPLNKDDDKNSDPDNDGLSNATERQLGTDPKNSDTDYGGDKDGEEVSRGADPLYEGDDDPDKDGLKNFEERRYGSNPFDPDTDKGGIRDGKEAKLGFNPTKKQDDDSDADGLSDLDEDNRYLTNKFLFDTDHGGIGDGEEISKKTNPLDANDDDPDKDGLVNLEESVYGTNPFIFDTDKGCSGDGDEVKGNRDPLNGTDDENSGCEKIPDNDDWDSDGLKNVLEYSIGTNPRDMDTDKGGDSDGFEVEHNQNPLIKCDDDPDRDGLTNCEEEVFGTNPKSADSDGGGVNDSDEIKKRLNPNNKLDDSLAKLKKIKRGLKQRDFDLDGLENSYELALGLKAYDSDSDEGGTRDLDELLGGTDPKNPDDDLPVDNDPDRDTLETNFEKKIGTNPYKYDTDEGGIGDGIEYRNKKNPLKKEDDKEIDQDQDGLSDDQEKIAGTKISDKDSDKGGITDLEELRNGTNPLDASDDLDRDRDRLKNTDEAKYGTDPDDPDTDAGGVRDGDEVQIGSNPLDFSDDADLDRDRDRLSNDFEVSIGSDPDDPDTDNGGIPDGKEVDLGLNPLLYLDDRDNDRDGDGLLNDEESEIYLTDPDIFDTDEGGIDDGTEVRYLTNPLESEDDQILDRDGDKLTDQDERAIYKTDPNNPDTDNGGIQDGAEVFQGNNPLDLKDEADIDRDGDGLTNLEEIQEYHTNPDDYDTDDGSIGDGDEVDNEMNPLDKKDDADLDRDGDGLLNEEEVVLYVTNPDDADTDDGGINDGQEVRDQTDPLNGSDDLLSDLAAGKEEGIYLMTEPCSSCPCAVTVMNAAQIKENDFVFAAIMNEEKNKIFSMSNFVEFENVEKGDEVPQEVLPPPASKKEINVIE